MPDLHRPRGLLTRILALAALSAMFTSGGCTATPSGPAFRWAVPPTGHRARVYLYRLDERRSLAVVRTTLDGEKVLNFRDGEYETFEVEAGSHRLQVAMRGLALLSMGWNEHTFRVRPGEIIFLNLDVRIDTTGGTQRGVPRALEVAGRSDEQVSENVFIGEKTRSQAAADLEITTRLVRSD